MSRARKQWLEWFRVDRDILDHPKTIDLAGRALWHPEVAVGRLIRLWSWVARHAPHGRLTAIDAGALDLLMERAQAERRAETITVVGKRREAEAGYDEDWPMSRGPHGALTPFVDAGFLDPIDGGGYDVHDWYEMNGSQLREREYDRRRQSSDTSIPAQSRSIPGGFPSSTETVTVRRRTRHSPPNTSSAEPALPLGVPGLGEAARGLQPPRMGVVARLPTVAPRGFYSASEADVAGWEAAYPGVNVRQALREMIAWLQANPTRQKTSRGMPRFIVAWLAREQNRPGVAAQLSGPRRGSDSRYLDANEVGE